MLQLDGVFNSFGCFIICVIHDGDLFELLLCLILDSHSWTVKLLRTLQLVGTKYLQYLIYFQDTCDVIALVKFCFVNLLQVYVEQAVCVYEYV